jgi:hypothetical protein
MPREFSEARSEAVACPVAQMPQIRLVIWEAALFELAIGHFDDNVAVTFDAGNVMDINAFSHRSPSFWLR